MADPTQLCVAILCAVCAPLAVASTQESWNQFRGPGGRGAASESAPLPARLDRAANLAWSCAVPEGHSSPVLHGERVFLTGHEEGELVTLCIDRDGGEVLWSRAVTPASLERHHRVNGPSSPTPVADGERVIASFGSFGLVAYDHSGEELWRRPLPLPDNTFGTGASPILADGKLVLVRDTNAESFVEALSAATGETLWRTDRAGFGSGWSTPAVWRRGATSELLVNGDGRLVAYDLADGSERWDLPGLTDEPIVMPVPGDGLVYLTSYNMRTNAEVIGVPAFADLLVELDADGDGRLDREEAARNVSVLSRFDADGEGDHPLRIFFRRLDGDRDGYLSSDEYAGLQRWVDGFAHLDGILALRPGDLVDGQREAAEIVWRHARGVPECPTPLLFRGRLYAVKNGGLVTCLDARTGEVLFEGRTGLRGPLYASPVAGDGKVYVASARGEVAVLAAADELRVLAVSDLGERIMSTPALAGGRVFVRSAGHLFAFEAGQ